MLLRPDGKRIEKFIDIFNSALRLFGLLCGKHIHIPGKLQHFGKQLMR